MNDELEQLAAALSTDVLLRRDFLANPVIAISSYNSHQASCLGRTMLHLSPNNIALITNITSRVNNLQEFYEALDYLLNNHQ